MHGSNASAGVAGDMTMASLVDAGADQFAIIDAISSFGIDGWAITFEDVQRCGCRAKWSNVVIHEHDTPHHHRPAQQILDLIGSSGLSAVTRDRAVAVYQTLAEVEGSIHGVDPAEVELHEVGSSIRSSMSSARARLSSRSASSRSLIRRSVSDMEP